MEFLNFLEETQIWGVHLINGPTMMEMLLRYVFNLLMVVIVGRYIYYSLQKNREYLFAFFTLNTVIFFVCYMMSSVQLSVGFAFGLFAIFSILRYRTTTVPIREMTYLFIFISLAVINALSTRQVSYGELFLINAVIAGLTYMLERHWFARSETAKYVIYEKIENLKPENHNLLLEDLRERTGLQVHRVEIGRIDFLRDIVHMRVYYVEHPRTSRNTTLA